jgi:hypothetical protein
VPKAQIASKRSLFALEKLHGELGGKIKDNKREASRTYDEQISLYAFDLLESYQAASASL